MINAAGLKPCCAEHYWPLAVRHVTRKCYTTTASRFRGHIHGSMLTHHVGEWLAICLFTVLLVYVQVYRTNSIHITIFMVVLPHFATLMPSICSYFTLWKCNVLELDKVNFKEAIASKVLRNCEVARLVGVSFPSGWERCDVPSPNTWIERVAQTSICTQMYSMCLVYDAVNEQIIKKQCCTNIMDHMYVCTHRHSYHNMYFGIINFSIPSSSQSSNTHCKCLEPYTAYMYYNSTYLYIL